MADAYRAVVGLTAAECPDAEALDRTLNPACNPYRRETLNIGVHAPLMRALQHAHFTFAKKISHTADSQDQRHRMVPGSRPLLTLGDTRAPDYITPALMTFCASNAVASQHTMRRYRLPTPRPRSTPSTSARHWESMWSFMLPDVSSTMATLGKGCRRLGRTTSGVTELLRDGLR